jgi:amino acid permease
MMDDYFKQVGPQAALLAGFGFAILAFLPQENESRLTFWFVLCAVGAVALELLAAFILCMLAFFTKVERTELLSDSFKWENRIALLSYLLGIVAFLVGIVLLVWIRFLAVAPIVTGLVSVVFVLGAVLFVRMFFIHDRIANLEP